MRWGVLNNSIGCEEPNGAIRRMQKQGALNHLNMYWSWHRKLNFGDWIGPYLFKKITGMAPLHCRVWRVSPPDSLYFTVGSIFRKIKKPDVAIVWGSGTLDMQTTPQRPKRTLALRGPLSQQIFDQLGFDVPDVVGDPGLCLPLYYRPHLIEKKYRLGIVPHGFDLEAWTKITLPPDVKLINVDRNVEEVIDDIVSCEKIASSSLHGIIEAHAYGIPACWIRPIEEELIGDDTKFFDYFRSVDLPVSEGVEVSGREADFITRSFDEYSIPSKDIAQMAMNLLEVCPFNAVRAQLETLGTNSGT